MKRYSRHDILLLAIAASLLSACAEYEEMLTPQPPQWTQGLAVQPYIEGSGMATRAYDYYDGNSYSIDDNVPGDDELKENDLGTRLDVFIAGQGSDPFWMQYHLVQGQETANGVAGVQASVLNETADLLAKKWTDVKDPNNHPLVSGRKYDVYVAVNNTATNADIASKAALLALTYQNESVYKLYGATTTGAYDALRRMLMDGHVEWTCQDIPLQKIQVPLKRAEAKVVVTVDISPAFLAQLREETGLDTPIGIPTATETYLQGAPAWKYVNWCMDTKVFADGNDITPTLHTDEGRESMTENSLRNGLTYYYYNGKEKDENGDLSSNTNTEVYFTDHDDDANEYGRKYIDLYPKADELSDGHSVERTANGVPRARIITYTYATSWGNHADERAPYVLVSYPFFRKKDGVTTVSSADDIITTYNYFRIPLCDEQANTGLKRNYIYKVNAMISGAGSTSFTENEANVNLRYEVLPWTHNADEDVKVKGESFHYFYVTPTTYNLRGDNNQSVNLNYYAAKGDVVKFRNLQVYYYNSSGTKVTIHNSTNEENTNGLTTESMTGNNNAGKNYSVTIKDDGTISVSSDALDNRAVKYISFQAYMTYVDDEGRTQTMTEDIIIKHFPLDNIQNIEGSWSSKYESISTTVREYSFNPTADGWESWDGVEQRYEVERGTTGAQKVQETITRDQWTANVPQVQRQGATENNPYKGNDGYYYWGTDDNTPGWFQDWSSDYDWTTSGWLGTTIYHRYANLYRAKYYLERTRYYRDVEIDDAIIVSDWVMWGIQDGTTKDDNFTAKVYYNGYCYNISDHDSRGAINNNLTNNHMYILQISSTSDQYILGHAVLDGNFQSQDHVVSPALMIASQLGAVTQFNNARNAAIHCGQYMEVGTDGTKYVGWRLPTKEEINVIINYQNDDKYAETIVPVLTGRYYWTLDGTAALVSSGTNGATNNAFVRCVRDLTADEINAINSK